MVCRSCVLDCEAECELKGFCWQVASVYSAGLLETGSRGLVIDLHTEKKVPAVLQDFGPISEDIFQLRCPLQTKKELILGKMIGINFPKM